MNRAHPWMAMGVALAVGLGLGAPRFAAAQTAVASGRYIGDGTGSHAITGLGFAPAVVIVKGDNATSAVVRSASMGGDAAKPLGTASKLKGQLLKSLDADGFTVGNDPATNAAGSGYSWTAFAAAPGRLLTGSYAGTGAAGRRVVTGFPLGYLLVMADAGQFAVQRFGSESGDGAMTFAGSGEMPGLITADTTGITLGPSALVNALGTTYHFVVWAASPGVVTPGTYGGDGTTSRGVTIGTLPYALIVSGTGATRTALSMPSLGGDRTLPAVPDTAFAGGIQAVTPTGFQVGSRPEVNTLGAVYDWVAFQNPTGYDLKVSAAVASAGADEGAPLAFMPSIANLGPTDATNVIVHAPVPTGLAFANAAPSLGSYDPVAGNWLVGTLPAGATATLALNGTVQAGTAGQMLRQTVSLASSDLTDLNATNDVDSTSVPVLWGDLDVRQTLDDLTPVEGAGVTFTIRVLNHGPSPMPNVIVADPLPSGLALAGATPSRGSFSPANAAWSVGTLAVGDSAVLTLGASVNPGAAGTPLVNTAWISHCDRRDLVSADDTAGVAVMPMPARFRVATGSYVGNGAGLRVIPNVGFEPALLLVKGNGAVATQARSRTMSSDAAKELGTSTALAAGRITGLTASGFLVGGDASVNALGTTYTWTAFLDVPGILKVGTYVGNGVDSREVSGVGFQPCYVMVLGENGKAAYQRFASESGDASTSFGSSGETPGRIKRLDPDGFQVGNAAEVNASGVTYHYVAWSTTAGLVASGVYPGDGTDGRNLDITGFRPDELLIDRNGSVSVFHSAAAPGDVTYPVPSGAAYTDGVQATRPHGFQVGADATVNSGSKTYFYTAFRDGAGADVGVTATADDLTPHEGETMHFGVRVDEYGPLDATAVTVADVLPTGVTLVAAPSASQGTWDGVAGAWNVGSLAAGSSATLDLVVTVNPGTAGSTLVNRVHRTASAPADPIAADDADSIGVVVQLADLDVTVQPVDATPTDHETATWAVQLVNHGPTAATNVRIRDAVPAPAAYQSAVASLGSYDAPSGTWMLTAIPAGASATLTLTAAPPIGLAGTTLVDSVQVIAVDQSDPVPANNVATSSVVVQKNQFRLRSGQYTGDGSASHAIAGIGFQPDFVVIKGNGATPAVARTRTMGGDAAKELGTTNALLAAHVRSLDADGFTVGSDVSVNAPGTVYTWTAFLEAPGEMKVGSYTGDGTDNRSLTGVGFAPQFVIVMGAGARSPVQRFAAEVGDATLPIGSGGEASDKIQALGNDGFQAGTNGDVNAAGTVYHYVAWAAGGTRVDNGLYLGNGTAGRAIHDVGFRPGLLWIKRQDSGMEVARPSILDGDVAQPLGAAAPFANGIQALLPDGFQTGTDATVNGSGKVYFWTALRDVPGLDLAVTDAVSDTTPNEGESIHWTVRLYNLGPETATGVQVVHPQPAGTTFQSYLLSRGTFDSAQGLWTVGSIAAGDSASIDIQASVDAGTVGSVLRDDAYVSALDQTDSNSLNDQASAPVRVSAADLELHTTVDKVAATEGDTLHVTVSLHNHGPDPATGVVVHAERPAGLTPMAATASQGSYLPTPGTWTVGTLARDSTATLALTVFVAAGTGGDTLEVAGAVTASTVADPAPGNESDSTAIFVALAPGIQVIARQTASTVGPGAAGIELFAVRVLNSGAQTRTLQGIAFTNRTTGAGTAAQLDAELGTLRLYRDDGDGRFDAADSMLAARAASGGQVVFDSLGLDVQAGSLEWLYAVADVPLGARDGDVLDLSVAASGDLTFDRLVNYLNAFPVEPAGGVTVDGMTQAQLTLHPAPDRFAIPGDVHVPVLDVTIPSNGYAPDVLNEIHLANLGTAVAGTDVRRVELWGDGGNQTFDAGMGDDFRIGTATWDGARYSLTGLIVPVPIGGIRLFVSTDLADSARAGRTMRVDLPAGASPGVVMASGNSGPRDAAIVASGTLTVRAAATPFRVWAPNLPVHGLLPGDAGQELLRLVVANEGAAAETLTTVTLHDPANPTTPAARAQQDADWLPLQLVAGGTTLATGAMAQGRVTLGGFAIAIAPHDSITLSARSGASLAAHTPDPLGLAVAAPDSDLVFTRPVAMVDGASPVFGNENPVEGMAFAQLAVHATPAAGVITGSTRNLALDATVPSNGASADTLRLVLVTNLGDARPATDLAKIELWADDGDGVFRPGVSGAPGDTLLGTLGYVGNAWALTGFQLIVPPGGRRIFLSCDIAADAIEGRSVRLAFPSTPFQGVGMISQNSGPRDQDAPSPVLQTISTLDRVVFTTQDVPPHAAAPGDTAQVLLHLVARNTYPDSARTLGRITIENASTGAGALPSDLDAEIHRVRLHADDPHGPVLGTGFFVNGRAVFGGLAFAIPASSTRDLYVTGDLSTTDAADGDELAVGIGDESEVAFTAPTAIAAHFPLGGTAVLTVDGMIAAQLTDLGGAGTTLGPGEGPVVALDVLVPRNAYRDDVLEGVRLVNAGSAGAGDIGQMRLWRDGGNGAFDSGAGDDVDLGPMTYLDGRWVSPTLSEAVPAAGARLFVAITASATPADSASVRLQVPLDGLGLRSGNDGPNDVPFTSRTAMLLSTAHLLASFGTTTGASVVGDTLVVPLTVRNVGSLAVTGITPAALAATGDGAFTAIGSVSPPTLDLAPGTQGTFLWSLRAVTPGTVTLATSVSGTEQGTGALQRSLTVASPPRGIFVAAQALSVFGVPASASTAQRGQTQLVPLTLTFTHPGGTSVSDILLHGLHLELEDETGAGIAPASLLAAVGLHEGASVYLATTSFADTGRVLDLPFAHPVRIENGGGSGGQVTLTLSIDLSSTTNVSSFRLVLPSASAFDAVDAVSGAPVPVALDSIQTYPLRSGLTTLVSGATQVDVTAGAGAAANVSRGQAHVPLLATTMLNPGNSSLGPDIRVASFGVALVDSTGARIAVPASRLARIRVAAPGLTLLDRAVTASDGAVMTLALSPLLTLPMNTPLAVTISGDVADTAVVGPVRLVLADTAAFVARNGVDNSRMAAVYDTAAARGPLVTIQQPADSVRATMTPQLPAALIVGATDVVALTLTLRHPGGPSVSSIACDALQLTCRDQSGQPLQPARFLSRARALVGGTEVGLVTNLPSSGGSFTLPLAGVTLAPGQSVRAEVRISIEPTAPLGLFELTLPADGIQAHESNLGNPIAAAGDSGATFPFSSGITQLQAPAREVAVGFADEIPAVLVAGPAVPAARVTLTNTNASGQIPVDHLTLEAGGAGGATVAIGAVVARVEAWVADTLWAAVDLAPGAATATVSVATPLVVGPQSPMVVDLRIVPRAGATTGFRVGLAANGIGVVQPDSPLLSIAVVPAPGSAFPFWTRMSGFTAATLHDSYSNFPNPFAAGRETSRFAFYLRSSARVTLTVWTVRGEKVTTLLDGTSMATGLHQDTMWDGRNGHGDVVVNGAYVAEIHVRYDDGTSERELRKVAVVR